MTEKSKPHPDADPNVSFTERNIARWTGAFGVRTNERDGKVERVLERKNDRGEVVSRVRISAVGYNGKLRILSFEHKKMWNLIERLFERQGYPADCWIEISSISFYDFLFDITSMDDPSKRKYRHTKKHGDIAYDLLMVLMLTPWAFENWELRGGAGVGVKGINLVREFEMYGKPDVKGTFGQIRIRIDPDVADGLRQRNTTPILIEIQNSIKSPTAGILYGYLSQILYKMPTFKMDIFDLAERLQIGNKDQLVRDMRRAAKEIEGLDFASGRIVECKVEKEGRSFVLRAVRGIQERRKKIAATPQDRRRAEEQQVRDRRIEESAYLRRFEILDPKEKAECQEQIDALLRERVKNGLGLETHRRIATIEIMENYFTRKNDELVGAHCLGEPDVAYVGNRHRAALNDFAYRLRQYAALRHATDPA